MSMHLKPQGGGPIHLSHLHPLVSAYAITKETVERLERDLESAVAVAHATHESVIVEQDCLDHFFVVHPSGLIDLCCRMRSYVPGRIEGDEWQPLRGIKETGT